LADSTRLARQGTFALAGRQDLGDRAGVRLKNHRQTKDWFYEMRERSATYFEVVATGRTGTYVTLSRR
jgi:hypothetical protein